MSKTFDRYASFVFFALGAAFVTESMRISTSAYGSNVGPNIFPMGLGIVLLLLSLRLFYETFRYSGSKDKKPTLNYKNFLIILGTTFLYALFMEQIGYVISTFLFLIIGF
jgi:putative tricarboxylic transport membrane protein